MLGGKRLVTCTASRSPEAAGNGFNAFQTGPESGDGCPVFFQFTVRQIPDVQIGNTTERRTAQLGANLRLTRIRRDKKQCR